MAWRRRRIVAVCIIILVVAGLFLLTQRPSAPRTKFNNKIAKVTVASGKLSSSSAIKRCLASHTVQNLYYGYRHFILTTDLVPDIEQLDVSGRSPGAWSKDGFLLRTLLEELVKPEADRLSWLFWVDADTLILNPHIDLETFLPPESDDKRLSQVHLFLGHNFDGINTGAFFIRVHPWSVEYLTSILSFKAYHPEDYVSSEQRVANYVLYSMPRFMGNWAAVPMRWFNSLPVNETWSPEIHMQPMRPTALDDGEDHGDAAPWKIMKGDMLVHFAGFFKHRDTWINPWAERTEKYLEDWSSSKYRSALANEVKVFWSDWSDNQNWSTAASPDEDEHLLDRSQKWLRDYQAQLITLKDWKKWRAENPDVGLP